MCAILVCLDLVHESLHVSVGIHLYKKMVAHGFAIAIMADLV